jgi:truncated hemoglobin YjbI
MTAALDELAPVPELRARFDEYFAFAAESMRNRD